MPSASKYTAPDRILRKQGFDKTKESIELISYGRVCQLINRSIQSRTGPHGGVRQRIIRFEVTAEINRVPLSVLKLIHDGGFILCQALRNFGKLGRKPLVSLLTC